MITTSALASEGALGEPKSGQKLQYEVGAGRMGKLPWLWVRVRRERARRVRGSMVIACAIFLGLYG